MTSIFSLPLNVIKQMALADFSTFNGETTAEYVRIVSIGCEDLEEYKQLEDEENFICVVEKIGARRDMEEGEHPYLLTWDKNDCTFTGSMQLDQPASKYIDHDSLNLSVVSDFNDRDIDLFKGNDVAYDIDCPTKFPIIQYRIEFPFTEPFVKKIKCTTLRELFKDVKKEFQKAYATDKLPLQHALEDYVISSVRINGVGTAFIDIEA